MSIALVHDPYQLFQRVVALRDSIEGNCPSSSNDGVRLGLLEKRDDALGGLMVGYKDGLQVVEGAGKKRYKEFD